VADLLRTHDLSDAFCAAIQDALGHWRREYAKGDDLQTAYALWVKHLHLSAQLSPGGPTLVIIEVEDRRRGCSTVEHYVVERNGGKRSLQRTLF
jgi:hypothetical protein